MKSKIYRQTFRRKISAAIHQAYLNHGYSNERITVAVMRVVNARLKGQRPRRAGK